MSDMRDEFEKWAELYIGWNDLELKRDNDDPDSYLMDITQYAWSAWQAARAQGGQGAELDEYQKFDEELCQEVFEKLNAEFDKDPKGGITVYTEDWRASVHHLKRLPRQNIGTIGYANTQPAVPEGWKLVPVEATGDMEEAGCQGYMEADGNWHMHRSSMGFAYKAMLEAAPTPTTPQADGCKQAVVVTVCYQEGCSEWEPIYFSSDASDEVIEATVYEDLYHEIHSNPGFRSYSWKRVESPQPPAGQEGA